MKRSAIITFAAVVLIAFISLPVSAQLIKEKGFKAGLNLSFHRGNKNGNTEERYGSNIGIFASFGVHKFFSIQPEMYYTSKGSIESETPKKTWKLDYLEIPVLINILIQEENNNKISLLVGPALAFNLNSKKVMSSEPYISEEISGKTIDLKNVTKSLDFGMVIGLNLRLIRGIQIEPRYTHGLTSIDDSDDGNKIKNSVFSILVGLSF